MYGGLEITGSNVTNIIGTLGTLQTYEDNGPRVIKVQRSTIRNASFFFEANFFSKFASANFTFDDSTLNNILINGTSYDRWDSSYLYQYRVNILIRNCIQSSGNIILSEQRNTLDIRNSTLNQVNLIAARSAYYYYYYYGYKPTTMIIVNSDFQNGLIKMSLASVAISRSNVSLRTPPLDTGRKFHDLVQFNCSFFTHSSSEHHRCQCH